MDSPGLFLCIYYLLWMSKEEKIGFNLLENTQTIHMSRKCHRPISAKQCPLTSRTCLIDRIFKTHNPSFRVQSVRRKHYTSYYISDFASFNIIISKIISSAIVKTLGLLYYSSYMELQPKKYTLNYFCDAWPWQIYTGKLMYIWLAFNDDKNVKT
jgi:hypothetical protein